MYPRICSILFEHAHAVAYPHETATDTNLAFNEMMESDIIKDTKRWRTNNEKSIQESPQLTMMVAKASYKAEQELRTSYRQNIIKEEADIQHANRRFGVKVDGLRKTALNLLEMVRFLNHRKYLGVEHTHSPVLMNLLPTPAIRIED